MKSDYPIHIKKMEGGEEYLTKEGCFNFDLGAKCVIFPKGKTTWEGFQRPFKEGDIVATERGAWIGIIRDKSYRGYFTYAAIYVDDGKFCTDGTFMFRRFATEEEKQKLFEAIKDKGYRWNAETKTLEKWIKPKFKVGDVIQDIDSYKVKIAEVNIEDECYVYESMIAKGIGGIAFSKQDEWELVPDKFDITTLKPFDKVLCRDSFEDTWTTGFYSHFETTELSSYYVVNGTGSDQCIPYNEDTKHLIGTTNDCDEYYKT
jgi:hypothetical protein